MFWTAISSMIHTVTEPFISLVFGMGRPARRMRNGVIRERRGDLDGAIEAHREAIRLNRGFAEGSNTLAVLFSSLGRLGEAIQVWETAAYRRPDDSVITPNLAIAYRKKGDNRKAHSWQPVAERLQAGRRR